MEGTAGEFGVAKKQLSQLKIATQSVNLPFTLKGEKMPENSYFLASLSKDKTPVAWAITKGDIKDALEQVLERKPGKKELETAIYIVGEAISDWPQTLSENLTWITDPNRRQNLLNRYISKR